MYLTRHRHACSAMDMIARYGLDHAIDLALRMRAIGQRPDVGYADYFAGEHLALLACRERILSYPFT